MHFPPKFGKLAVGSATNVKDGTNMVFDMMKEHGFTIRFRIAVVLAFALYAFHKIAKDYVRK
jgi:hypothetical protein